MVSMVLVWALLISLGCAPSGESPGGESPASASPEADSSGGESPNPSPASPPGSSGESSAGSTSVSLPDLPGPGRSSFGDVVVEGKIYVVGGHVKETHIFNADNLTDRVDSYDIATNTWSPTLAPRPRAAEGFWAVAYGNKYIYAFGGLTHHVYSAGKKGHSDPTMTYQSVADIDRYDIQTNSWATLSVQLPEPRSSYVAGVVGDTAYLIGGWHGDPNLGQAGGKFLRSIVAFDLATETVSTTSFTLPDPVRRALTAVTLDNHIILIGGITDTVDPNKMMLNNVTQFTPVGGTTWTDLAPLPVGTFAPGAVFYEYFGGSIYAFGGYTGGQDYTDKVYNLRVNPYGATWQEYAPMPQQRGFVAPFVWEQHQVGLLAGALNPALTGQQSNAFNSYR